MYQMLFLQEKSNFFIQ